jgi:hypothetical protein
MGAASGTMLSYDEYTTQLLSAAFAFDDHFQAWKAKRHVMTHEFQNNNSFHDDDPHVNTNTMENTDDSFDIDNS